MSKLDHRLAEYRALRKAAHALLQADLAQLRAAWSAGKIAARAGRNISRKADNAAQLARKHQGIIVAGAAAVAGAATLWFARAPILKAIASWREKAEAGEPGDESELLDDVES